MQKSGISACLLMLFWFILTGCSLETFLPGPLEQTSTVETQPPPLPTPTPAALYPSGSAAGVFLTQRTEVNRLLPGILDVSGAVPFDPGPLGSGAFVVATPELRQWVNSLGYALTSGQVVSPPESGSTIPVLVNNITAYRDPQLNAFVLALPNQVMLRPTLAQQISGGLQVETQVVKFGKDGLLGMTGVYSLTARVAPANLGVMGAVPFEIAYSNLFLVSAVADIFSQPIEGEGFEHGTPVAIVVQITPEGSYQALTAFSLLIDEEHRVQVERGSGEFRLFSGREGSKPSLVVEVNYDVSTMGIPTQYQSLADFLDGYVLATTRRDGREWVTARSPRGMVFFFPDNFSITNQSVTGYYEAQGSVWKAIIRKENGQLSFKASQLSQFDWANPQP